jgi:hypothetical protein
VNISILCVYMETSLNYVCLVEENIKSWKLSLYNVEYALWRKDNANDLYDERRIIYHLFN